MYERIVPRLGAASGALFVVLLFGLSSSGSDSTVVIVLELLGLLLFIPFLGYLWSIRARPRVRGAGLPPPRSAQG